MGITRQKSRLEEAKTLISQQLEKEPQSVIVLLGQTASGKTALALELAEFFPIEIVSADSRLIYKGMDIGTAKPSKAEQELVPHHLLDVVNPDQRYTVADYQKEAFKIIDDILKRKKIPLIVGGTMLYIDSIIYNYQLATNDENLALREKIRSMSLDQLQKQLLELIPDAAAYIDIKNPVRLMRVLEHYQLTGEWLWEKARKEKPKYPYLLLGLSVDKETLTVRITKRIEQQLKDGLIGEVTNLLQKYPKDAVAMTGIGYRQVIRFLEKESTELEMREQLKKDTLAYAKRQMTWWKRNKEIQWLN